ncbi:uncharacterized protein (DUF58 family) [Mycetocola sp. CAN_C7]|uniref:DUF58 domain-containing protein n=1 Tax=Mycetocola sp. CAN_C7 TaxID=2787724 RepID=UPI0018CABE52
MDQLLHRVKTKLAIRAHRKVRGLLDGEYVSLFHGKSLDFDDLRAYTPGDDVKDIDWKATARVGAPLTKRYIAARKHAVMLVVDTGRDFAALSASGGPKRDVAVLAAGVMGYLAVRHGDHVGLVAGDADETEHVPFRGTESHLERILGVIHRRTSLTAGPSRLATQLDYVRRTFRRRMILVVFADDGAIDPDNDDELRLLRRLHAQHEILWITVGDADPTLAEFADHDMFDVADGRELPAFLRRDSALRADFAASVATRTAASSGLLERIGISSHRLTGDDDVVPGLFRLLEVHNHARH